MTLSIFRVSIFYTFFGTFDQIVLKNPLFYLNRKESRHPWYCSRSRSCTLYTKSREICLWHDSCISWIVYRWHEVMRQNVSVPRQCSTHENENGSQFQLRFSVWSVKMRIVKRLTLYANPYTYCMQIHTLWVTTENVVSVNRQKCMLSDKSVRFTDKSPWKMSLV